MAVRGHIEIGLNAKKVVNETLGLAIAAAVLLISRRRHADHQRSEMGFR